jgi:hypothetical protein
LYKHTNYAICNLMVQKIEQIEASQNGSNAKLKEFIRERQGYLAKILSFSQYEYSRLNEGIDMDSILEERSFIEKIMQPK